MLRTRRSSHRLVVRALAPVVASALMLAPAASADSGPAPAPQVRAEVALSSSDLITAVVDGDVLALRGRPEQGPLADPDDSVFSVSGTAASGAAFAATDLGLPAGTSGSVEYQLDSVRVPDGAKVTVTSGGATLLDTTDLQSSKLTVPVGGRVQGTWTFSAPGRYWLTFVATAHTTLDGEERVRYSPNTTYAFDVGETDALSTTTTLVTELPRVDPGSAARLVAQVEPSGAPGYVEFSEGDTLLGHAAVRNDQASLTTGPLATGEHAFTARYVPLYSTDERESTSPALTIKVADPVVLATGSVSVTPKVGGISEDGKEFSSLELGLLDRTGTYADQRFYGAPDVILNVSDREHDAATGTWSTPNSIADVPDIPAYTTGPDARLLLGQDTAAAAGGINAAMNSAIRVTPQFPTRLVTATAPAGGRLRVVRGANGLLAWDSELGADEQLDVTSPKLNTRIYNGWTFDAPGRYCVTVKGSLTTAGQQTTINAQATYTIYVGPLPEHPASCAQVPAEGAQVIPKPEITVLDHGHTDVRVMLDDAGTGLVLGAKENGFNAFKDLVFTGVLARQVPAADGDQDLTFIGAPGSDYWTFPNPQDSTVLWPGFSTESLPKLAPGALASFTLEGINGPPGGEVLLFDSDATNTTTSGSRQASGVYYDSRRGLPQTVSFPNASHSHISWVFTREGRYCLNFAASAKLVEAGLVRGSGQLTVWVGDAAQAKDVVPCERAGDAPVVATPPAITTTPRSEPLLVTAGLARLEPHFAAAGGIDVGLRVQPHTVDPIVHYDPDDVIVSTTRKISGVWRFAEYQSQSPQLGFDSTAVAFEDIDGPIDWAIGDVRGPAGASFSVGSDVVLDSAPGGPRHFALLPRTRFDSIKLTVPEPGVYCVPFTWTATKAGTTAPVSVTKTLTVVAGSTDPVDVDYVDRAHLTSCTRGQQPTPPAGGGPVTANPWDVPNGSLTEAGQTILNDGHVDLASRIEDGVLTTAVKDSTESSTPVYRPLPDTVLQLLPDAQTAVPDVSGYAFLGTPGAPVWQVSQTQQDGLLWPGWSTEEIPTAATTGGVRWTLTGVRGLRGAAAPGAFALYETGSFGDPIVLFDSRDGVTAADSFEIPKLTHAHGNWAFSAEGAYCLAFTRTATAAGGGALQAESVLAVSVGTNDVTKVNPAACGSFASIVSPDPIDDGQHDPEPEPTPEPTPTPAPTATPDPGVQLNPGVEPGVVQPAPRSEQPVTPVSLTVKAIRARAKLQTITAKRVASIAAIACPKGGATCTLSVPKRVRVAIAGKHYAVAVLAAKSVKPGRTATVRVRLSAAAARRLKGRKATVRLKLTVEAGGRTVARTVKVTARGRPVRVRS